MHLPKRSMQCIYKGSSAESCVCPSFEKSIDTEDTLLVEQVRRSPSSPGASGDKHAVSLKQFFPFIHNSLFQEMPPSKWSDLHISSDISLVLEKHGFKEPTPIQEVAIPVVIQDKKDVLGAAVTGSGKTLAFAIPILDYIIKRREHQSDGDVMTGLTGLVLTPTRELAAQIKKHIDDIGQDLGVKTACLVGGLSIQKQQRLVSKFKPDIVVATPGRLWEFVQTSNDSKHKPYLTTTSLKRLAFLVIDEADRMTEKGHFEDLEKIADLLHQDDNELLEEDVGNFESLVDLECIDENGNPVEDTYVSDEESSDSTSEKIQRRTLIFSATLTFVHDAPERIKDKTPRNKKQKKDPSLDKLSKIISFFGLDTNNVKIIDLTLKGIGKPSADKLTELSVICSKEEKDLYLYYLLTEFVGKKVIVFCNSKDCLRRLTSVLKILKETPICLHADLDQKRRMKAIESFTQSSSRVLIASDVAARGLDISNIDLVVHFQVPRTTETYVHRSGRTARGVKTGTTVVFVDPSEGFHYNKLIRAVNGGDAFELLPVKQDLLKFLNQRVTLAKQINDFEHRFKKRKSDESWLTKMAREADIDLEDRDDLKDITTPEDDKDRLKLVSLKNSLKHLLGSKSFMPRVKVIGDRPLSSAGPATSKGRVVKRHRNEETVSTKKLTFTGQRKRKHKSR